MTGKFLEQPFKQSATIFSKSEEPRAPYVNREISSSGFRKVRGWLRSFSWIREDTVPRNLEDLRQDIHHRARGEQTRGRAV